MKNVGILTIYGDYENYGNRLQNLAVQEVLKEMKLNPKTIMYMHRGAEDSKEDYNKDRFEAFKEFNKKIEFYKDKLYMEKETPANYGNDLDFVAIGSDQIWNFTFKDIFSSKVFADFLPKEKRISFSASIGVDFLPDKDSEEYKVFEKNLNELAYISVREDVAKKLINDISGREDVQVILDPTMIMKKENWENHIKRPKQLDTDNFIVKSFLGKFSKEQEKEVREYAEKNNCKIIDISDENSEFYGIGPSEFLYLEKKAKMVVTDSFHSCVFAIIFSTPFVVFERDDLKLKSMHSRIETLLSTFKLEYRMFKGKITDKMMNYSYDEAHEILKSKREESMQFLKKAFGV